MGANIIELYPSGFVNNYTYFISPYNVEAGYHPAENTATNSTILYYLDEIQGASVYYTFDTSAFLESLPDSASIKSVICRVNINHSNETPAAAYVSLSSGTSPKGNSVNFSTSPEIITLDGGEWTRDELKDIRVRIYIKGFNGDVYFYGATLIIEYEGMQVFVANQNFNGVWEEMDSVWECYNGVWTEIAEGYENINGVWQETN